MTTINTNYNPYQNLSSYLGTSNGAQSGSTGTSNPIDALFNNDSSGDQGGNNLFNFLMQESGIRPYNLPVDNNGNPVIPTVDQMNAATTSDSMLTLANYVGQSVLMQTDAMTKTDNATRIKDVTLQAQSVLKALATATTGLSMGSDGLSDAQQKTTSEALNAMNTSLSQIVSLLPKTDDATRTTLTSQISDLDTLAFNIAGLTGTAWTSVTGNSANTISGYSASQSGSSSAATASNLLNITV